jgi:hypothetical protein
MRNEATFTLSGGESVTTGRPGSRNPADATGRQLGVFGDLAATAMGKV